MFRLAHIVHLFNAFAKNSKKRPEIVLYRQQTWVLLAQVQEGEWKSINGQILI